MRGQESARYDTAVVPGPPIPMGQLIPVGRRNATFQTYARDFFNHYMPVEKTIAILAMLNDRNEYLLRPTNPSHPHTTTEVRDIVTSVYKGRRQPTRRQALYLDEAPMKIYEYLMELSNGGTSWVRHLPHEQIGCDVGYSRRWVIPSLQKLEEWGLLVIKRYHNKAADFWPLPPSEEQKNLRGELGVNCSKGFRGEFSKNSDFNKEPQRHDERRAPLTLVKTGRG